MELQNRVMQNDVTPRVTNSNIVTVIFLSSYELEGLTFIFLLSSY